MFISISFILIALGLYRLEHTELSLVGFFLLFLLSLVIISGNLEYKIGYQEIYVYGSNYSGYHYDHYGGDPSPSLNDLNLFHLNQTNIYAPYQDDSGFFTTHRFGYVLAVMSVIGMVGSLASIKKDGWFK